MDPICFKKDEDVGGRRVSLPAYVVCQPIEIESPGSAEKVEPEQIKVRIRRFYRPEDISTERAYRSNVQEIYYSEDVTTVPILYIKGKCEVRTRRDFQSTNTPGTCEHIFFVEKSYDPPKSTHLLSTTVKSEERALSEAEIRKKKGKWKEGENSNEEQQNVNPLATLDIFAGCGGLSEGLEKSGVSLTKWAIEDEEPDSEAFRLNHPEALVLVKDSNVILRTIMTVCGDADDCISDEETNELAAKLDKKVISSLPRPGKVDFIIGGPPCQNFSQNAWSQIQYEKILTFLSYAEYFRPKFFLLENVPEFMSSNQGLMFQLTIASLLEMGYQVKFGILDVGAYGVSQSKNGAFIWGASPEEKLPEWPEPMHVFPGVELKITLDKKLSTRHVAVRSTSCGAPFRAITVRDTIGDLPDVKNGASETTLEYKDVAESWYQKKIRGNEETLMDHISEEMVELNLIRCEMIPKVPGADWSDLPKCKVQLDNGEFVDLIPRCSSMQQHQRKGLFGRLDWEGIFPTFSSDPHPLGEVGMCLHPEQDRMITVREYARSLGFPDAYRFAGNIEHKNREISNAVPPPLGYALGRKLKEAIENKADSFS